MDANPRSSVSSQNSNVPSTSNCENKNKKQSNRKPPDKSVDKYILSKHNLKEPCLVLENIGKSILSDKRTVLGDKTNKSPMMHSHSKQRTKSPVFEEKKMTTRRSSRLNVVDNMSFQAPKLSVSKKLTFDEKHPAEDITCSKKISKNNADVLDKCVYAKIQRESIRNKNMPFEEKLAQYEFEVDESEPTLNKRTKKKYNRKKKVKSSDENYCPSGKVFKNILKVGCELAEKDIKEKPRRVLVDQNVKLKFGTSIDELKENTIVESVPDYNCIQTTVSSLHSPVRKSNFNFLENTTPIRRPTEHKSQGRINVQGLENDCCELEVSATEKNSASNLRVFEDMPSRLSCPDQNVSIGSCVTEDHVSEKRLSNIDSVNSTAGIQSTSTVANISVSTPKWNNFENRSTPLRTYSSISVLSPLNKHDETNEVDPHFLNDRIVRHRPIPFSHKVIFAPRVSGGANNFGNNELAKEWTIDNCFGFGDNSDEIEISPFPNTSLKKRLRKTSPISSTPLLESKKNPERLSSYFKRKRELHAATLHTETHQNAANVVKPVMVLPSSEKEISSETTKRTPFSTPLMQSKLAFTPNHSKTPLHKTEEKNLDGENSPLLFKELEDNVLTHFKVPPRRSYVRSTRKKMKPLGDEWVEVDTSESEDDHENEHRSKREKRTKRAKINKEEEKKADKWIKNFNDQCDEIEEFELCVE